ncbi:DUF3078 domain-containing protein [Algoriphagus limi]|uniref:DUF3078 domain-containing protein n=1 Tax=Algoriphagus limi TaxID=2975273 RepID=A0ABT2G5L6_9BACT|nr:DUF3078 domain-containing protein [Algoriphagus limi]MCS5489232.1 DUF3078 domain-containing protein [Algoriphagus limi]
MKRFVAILIFTFVSGVTLAQEAGKDTTFWLKEIGGGLNFNQGSFSSNWTGGGVNSIALGMYLNGRANYAKDKWTWDNTLDMIYGVVKNQGEDTRKSNDRIFLDSKVGYNIGKHWNVFTSINFLSQFAPGYDFSDGNRTLISKFANPAYLMSSWGLEYKPNDEFMLRLSPFSPRFTFVTDTELYLTVPENYGVPIGDKVRSEWLAFSSLLEWNKKLSENVSLLIRHQLYANYETFSFKSIDQRLDVALTAKVSDLIQVSLTSLSIYDLDQDEKIQFSQGLALGIAFKRSTFPKE